MKNSLATVICLVLALALASAFFTLAIPWLRCIHSITIQNGVVEIETSPDGRLANPYRDTMFVSLKTVVILGIEVAVISGGVVGMLYWVFRRDSG